MNPQALEGVPDAMSVSNLTQASLLHTVRERYNRDEVSFSVSVSVSVSAGVCRFLSASVGSRTVSVEQP